MTTSDCVCQVILLGDYGVGKSNLLNRFANNKFSLESKNSMGVEFGIRNIQVNGMCIRVEITVIPGQERDQAIMSHYYKKADGALLVYDIASFRTYAYCKRQLNQLRQDAKSNLAIALVGNKTDLRSQRAVQTVDARAFAESSGIGFIEASALDCSGVEEAFVQILTKATTSANRAGADSSSSCPGTRNSLPAGDLAAKARRLMAEFPSLNMEIEPLQELLLQMHNRNEDEALLRERFRELAILTAATNSSNSKS